MTVPMENTAHVLGFKAAHLAIIEPRLGALGSFGPPRRQAPPLLKPMRLEKAAQRGIRRHRPQLGPVLAERDQIVVMKLDGPTLVGGVLRQQGLTHRVAHRRLLSGVRTHLAAQDADRIVPFLDGAIEPSLDGGDAETDRLTGARVTPLPRGKLLNLAAQRALCGRCRQQLADHRKAQPCPALVDPRTLSLRHAGAPPHMQKATVENAPIADEGRLLPAGEARHAACTACPPVIGNSKPSTAMSCSAAAPEKRSSSDAGRRSWSTGGMKAAEAWR